MALKIGEKPCKIMALLGFYSAEGERIMMDLLNNTLKLLPKMVITSAFGRLN